MIMFSFLSALFISIRREEEGGGREEGGKEEGGLWPVPRIKLNKFYVRAAYSEHARDVMGSFQGWVLP